MTTSSRFAVGVHVLALLALTPGPATSAYIAGSVNTNPALIRRMLVLLARAGFTRSVRGAGGGTMLARAPGRITLADIYRATEERAMLGLHRAGPNPDCPVGRHIGAVLGDVAADTERAVEAQLRTLTLADVLDRIQARQAA